MDCDLDHEIGPAVTHHRQPLEETVHEDDRRIVEAMERQIVPGDEVMIGPGRPEGDETQFVSMGHIALFSDLGTAFSLFYRSAGPGPSHLAKWLVGTSFRKPKRQI